VIKKEILKIKS